MRSSSSTQPIPVCAVTGTIADLVNARTCTITAAQLGDSNHLAAMAVAASTLLEPLPPQLVDVALSAVSVQVRICNAWTWRGQYGRNQSHRRSLRTCGWCTRAAVPTRTGSAATKHNDTGSLTRLNDYSH